MKKVYSVDILIEKGYLVDDSVSWMISDSLKKMDMEFFLVE